MNEYVIALIVGSLRRDSLNRKLAGAVIKLAPPDLSFRQVQIGDLPLYNADDDAAPSGPVLRLRNEIKVGAGPAVRHPRIQPLASRRAQERHRPRFAPPRPERLGGQAGRHPGRFHRRSRRHAMAQQHLRNILAYLDVPTLCQPEAFIQAKEGLFDEAGGIGPASLKFLQNWMDHFVAWVKKFAVADSHS